MSKARVYEVAKQVGVDNKALVETLNKLGIEGKSHMGSLSEEEVGSVLKYYAGKTPKPATPAAPVPTQERKAEPSAERPAQTSQGQSQGYQGNRPQGQGYQGNRPQGDSQGYQGNRPQGQGYQGNRPQGQGYQGNRPQGDGQGYQGNRPQGDGQGYQGNRPQGQGYQGNRPQGDGQGYQGNRPQGQGYQGNRPQGQGYQGNRPQGDGQGYQGNRPQGQGYQGNRPQGDGTGYQGNRPQGQGYQGNRPQGDGTGYQGNRPQGTGYQGNRPQGDGTGYQGNRPQGQGYQGNRPQGDGTGYQGNRPQGQGYQGNRPQGDGTGYQGNRPQGTGYQGNRPQGDGTGYQGNRPQGQGYQGNRPQGSGTGYQGNRPQGQGTGYQGNRPQGGGYQGNRSQGEGSGYQGNRSQGGQRSQGLSVPQPIIAPVDKEKRQQERTQSQEKRQQVQSREKGGPKARANQATKPPALTPRQRANAKKAAKAEAAAIIAAEESSMIIKIPETITVKDLSLKVNKQASDIIKILFMKRIMATANQELSFDMASSIAEELGYLCEKLVEEDLFETFTKEEPDKEEDRVKRPPIVVVMGHVDHGKTSLLDAIRKSKVTEGEHGGITQHIGASMVAINGQKITFLDTPGHEAFTAMRLRGAMATDIAILVVAADDGVMPQTIEAINHAKAAGVQIIVAINKIDKPGANPDRVKQELTEYGLVAEDWGGDTICVEVSALAKTNLDLLLEMVLLVAEMQEYKANPNREARGTVIEAQLDKGRGPVATVLVQNGTLNVGDTIIAGAAYGRIRAMMDDKGRRVKSATPSTPVEVLGLSEVPVAGDAFYTAENEKIARQFADRVTERSREKMISHTPHKVTLDDLFSQIQAGETKELKVIVKADVQGSVEAMRQSLNKLSNEKVVINVIHGGVGAINESDVMLASASNTIIIGFNVRPEAQAKVKADVDGVDIRLYRVIYNALEDIESAMKGMLDPEFREKIIGHAVIRQTFKVSGVGTIAGAYVTDGKLVRSAKVRLLRDNVVVYEGELDSLKRFKDDAKEVASNYECGLTLTKFNDLKEEDIIEAFIMEEIPR